MQPSLRVSIPSNPNSWTYKSLQVFKQKASLYGIDVVISDFYKQGQEITALMEGTVDAATISMEDISAKLKDTEEKSRAISLCQPFRFRNYADVTACFEAPSSAAIYEMIERLNLVVLTPLFLGSRVVQQRNIDGTRLRIPAGERWRELATTLGFQGVEVSNNDVKKAYEEGRIDAHETPLPQSEAYGLFPYVTKILDTNHKVDWIFLTVSKDTWQQLSEQQQHGLRVAAAIACKFNDENRMHEEVALQKKYAHLISQKDPTSSPAIIEQHKLWPGLGQINCKTGTLVAVDDKSVLSCWYGGHELPEVRDGFDETSLWLAHFSECIWSEPRCLYKEEGKIVWNPVFVRMSDENLALFFRTFPAKFQKEKEKPFTYHVMYSHDKGKSWSSPQTLPDGITGPIKCPPVALPDGRWLIGTAAQKKCSLEIMDARGPTFSKHIALPQDLPMSEPCLVLDGDGAVQIYFRNRQEHTADRFVMKTTYNPQTSALSPLERTSIPNPDSGIDAIRLQDGRMVLVANPSHTSRQELALYVSNDNGKSWEQKVLLEQGKGEYSQPSIIQTSDGLIHIMYAWWQNQEQKNIKHMIIDPSKVESV